MKTTFGACGLSFEVICDDRLGDATRFLTAAFPAASSPKYRLEIQLRPGGKYQRVGDAKELPFDERRDLLLLRDVASDRLKLDVRIVHPEAVSAALGYLFAHALSREGGLLLHAAALLAGGRMCAFVGRPGAGKSTLASNALSVQVVHDDKVAVRKHAGGWRAFGLPMVDNGGRPGLNRVGDLGCVALIEQANATRVIRCGGDEAVARLPQHVIVPQGLRGSLPHAFQLALDLVSEVEVFRLSVRLGDDLSDLVAGV